MPSTDPLYPLHIAASKGDIPTVKYLLMNKKANVNDVMLNTHTTPLITAVRNKQYKTGRHLLSYDANIYTQDQNGHTCLHCVLIGLHTEGIESLDEERACFIKEVLEMDAKRSREQPSILNIKSETPNPFHKQLEKKVPEKLGDGNRRTISIIKSG